MNVWEPFKPDARIKGIDMAPSLDSALEEADAILLLVRHTEFAGFNAAEIALKTKARIAIDCVNGLEIAHWSNAGFTVYRLGVNQSESAA